MAGCSDRGRRTLVEPGTSGMALQAARATLSSKLARPHLHAALTSGAINHRLPLRRHWGNLAEVAALDGMRHPYNSGTIDAC